MKNRPYAKQVANLASVVPTTGDIAYFDGTNWTRIPASTAGYVLTSAGAGVVPVWSAPAASGTTYGIGQMFSFDPSLDTATTNIGANACHYWHCNEAVVVTKLGLRIGNSSGSVSGAVYDQSGTGRSSVPGTRLQTSGSVSCPASGYAELTLGGTASPAAAPWIGFGADNGTATYGSTTNFGATSDNLPAGRQCFQSSSGFPCPSPVGTLANQRGRNLCIVGIP